jgi:hypothetical protein
MSAHGMWWRACRGLAVTAIAGCGRLAFDRVPDGAPPAPDAPLGDLSTFGTPELVPGLSVTGFDDDDPELTADQLELYFTSNRQGGAGGGDVWRSVRASTAEPWPAPVRVQELSGMNDETQPALCCDDLVMYLGSSRMPTFGNDDIFMATRATRDALWSTPVRVTELSAAGYDGGTALDGDGLAVFVDTDRTSGKRQIHRATRPTTDAPWSTPALLLDLAPTGAAEVDPSLAGDVALVFSSVRATPNFDLWIAIRPAPDQPFALPTPIAIANTAADERDPGLAADGRTLYFARRNDAGDYDIFTATR